MNETAAPEHIICGVCWRYAVDRYGTTMCGEWRRIQGRYDRTDDASCAACRERWPDHLATHENAAVPA